MTGDGKFTAACVQHCATNNLEANISILLDLIDQAVDQGADLVCLPEACDYLSNEEDGMAAYAQPKETHIAFARLTEHAKAHGIWLLIGSLTMQDESGSIVNRSLMVNTQGLVTSWYDKIHMFDACLPGLKASQESKIYRPGAEAKLDELPWGTIGLSICYDLRFPHLYRQLAKGGATMLSIPAAFTRPTGEALWLVLLRSRAIENGCFVFAPAQWGNHYGDRFSYGHSLIIDPWGRILADAGDGDGIATADIDMKGVSDARAAISSLSHDREFELCQLPNK